jgi:hypothetical protein
VTDLEFESNFGVGVIPRIDHLNQAIIEPDAGSDSQFNSKLALDSRLWSSNARRMRSQSTHIGGREGRNSLCEKQTCGLTGFDDVRL